jgi:hypothetical protein
MRKRSRLRGDGPFVLRREQLDVLAEVYTAQKFEERLMETMRANWPEECGALGEIGLRRRIMNGVCRATEYGFSEESEIGRFMNLIFLWGDDFDRDESRPQVLEILRSSTLSSRNRISQLINLAADELDEVEDEEEL